MKPRKPLKRTALKSPTLEAIQAWQGKPRRAIPRGKRPARQGRKAKREEAAWQLGRALVVERSAGFCEGPEIVGVHRVGKHRAHHVHHLMLRSRGGEHRPSNLLHICTALHDWIHQNPSRATELGLMRDGGSARAL